MPTSKTALVAGSRHPSTGAASTALPGDDGESPVSLWRIATETRAYKATDLSGAGAALAPGRWNHDRQPVVYCAQTIALAVLETAAHLPDAGLPLNRFVVQITVPAPIWAERVILQPQDMDPACAAIPAGQASADIGANWLMSLSSALLLVPSVIVPEEAVVLINPAHPAADRITATALRVFDYGRLFRRAGVGTG